MFNSLLPGTDNFFKYLLTLGFVMIAFGLLYPLKKKQELALQEIDIRMQLEKMGEEIKHLQADATNLKHFETAIQSEIDSLKALRKTVSIQASATIYDHMLALNAVFEGKKDAISKNGKELALKSIEQKASILKQNEVKGQILIYSWFNGIFFIGGALLAISGLLFWLSSSYIDDFKKGQELTPPYSSRFVRFVQISNRWFRINRPPGSPPPSPPSPPPPTP